MESGRLTDGGRLRWDDEHSSLFPPHFAPSAIDAAQASSLDRSITRAKQFLMNQQHAEGYWLGELEGDSILESEFLLLLAFLGEERTETARLVANHLLELQNADGGWSLYPGGPTEASSTVKAYLALKIVGHHPNESVMQRAKDAALNAGGVEAVNSFTRYYLAMLGIISYRKCPAVPPEMILLPDWFPVNIYKMSAWSRQIVMPLSIVWAKQPVRRLSDYCQIPELFAGDPRDLPLKTPSTDKIDQTNSPSFVPWSWFFRQTDRCLKTAEFLKFKPFRSLACRRVEEWMKERFAHSDGLGAIFPPIVWSIIAFKYLGYDDRSTEVSGAREELNKLMIREGETIRLQPCKSPVWDTALTTLALRTSGISGDARPVRSAVNWLLQKEVRQRGDWSRTRPDVEPSGWFFEFNNEFYPDADDTTMVLMALVESMPGEIEGDWLVEFLQSDTPQGRVDATILAGKSNNPQQAIRELALMEKTLEAIRRGVRWLIAMQGKDGGWGAFDADNDRKILTRVPFADHNAMIDPGTTDITARVLELVGQLGIDPRKDFVQKAITFVWSQQEDDGAWYGRWGVNYIYGTWQAVTGLIAVGIPSDDPRIRRAADWLKIHQNDDGGWGESPESYDDPMKRGEGPSTPSQTAWALLALMSAGETDSTAVFNGIEFLLQIQQKDGTWPESQFTGTGFPRVFYLKYHLYRVNFPLMAIGRYRDLKSTGTDADPS